MTSKTPVSILQEMCIRNGDVPHYELIHEGGGSHEAIFKYRVLVGEVSAIGSGRSKKEAKHDAAKCLLNRLGNTSVSHHDTADLASPYKGMLQENAVGALQELCMTHEIPVPLYEVIKDEGPPHAKQFTIMCQVSKLTDSAVARTKKQAKQLAAFKMLKMLRTSLADVLPSMGSDKEDASLENVHLTEPGDANIEVAVSRYKELGTLVNNTRKTAIGQKISEYHLMQKCLQSPLLNRLKTGDEELEDEMTDDPMDVLKRMVGELSLDADFTGIASTTSEQHIILLSISTTPQSVVFGIGETKEEACQLAAKNALKHLKIMTA